MPSLIIRHVTLYRFRQPVAFGEHRMMLRPRDSHDQRVIETSLEISPEPRNLYAFGNHVGAVLREHRAPRAFAVGPRGPRSRGRRKDLFRSTIAPTRCRTSPTASNAINPVR
jgi:transglutaminase-like putative cysteine protease